LQAFIAALIIEKSQKEFWPDNTFVIHDTIERLPTPFADPALSNFQELFSPYTGPRLVWKRQQKPSVNPYPTGQFSSSL
jgi:hypothetical protein